MPEFIVNRPACDYFTTTTFSPDAYYDALAAVSARDEWHAADKANIKRYAGQRILRPSGSVFFGEGIQSGARHFIISASGGAADDVAAALAPKQIPDLNVTRIDIQITIEKPDWYRARNFLDAMNAGEWKGRARKCMMIENGGDDTVYLGSYYSDQFCRVYVKEKEWLRFEVVFKADYAAKAWAKYRKVQHLSAGGLIVGQLVKMPAHPTRDIYAKALRGTNTLSVQGQRPIKTKSKTYIWLVSQVAPAIRRLLNDDDSRDQTLEFLTGFLTPGE